jgi:hypothetical protein
MTNLLINPEFISDTNDFKFVKVPSMYEGFIDVYYRNERIAIINGVSSPLQWTLKTYSRIPNKVMDKLEKMAKRLIKKSSK